ncbi:MAG: glycosyltransferase family 87 protein [bacterium]|nr:glycosyltransferase family 87 protein [bacterium]
MCSVIEEFKMCYDNLMKQSVIRIIQVVVAIVVIVLFVYVNGYEKHYGPEAIKHYGHIDLTVFYVAGTTITGSSYFSSHHIYNQKLFQPLIERYHPVGTGKHFLYPPSAAIFFAPLAKFSLDDVGKYWATSNAVLFVLTYLFMILFLLKDRRWYKFRYSIVLLAVTFSHPVISQFATGQINVVIWFLLMLFVLFFSKNRQLLSGGVLAIAMMTKIFPVMFALPLLLHKKWLALVSLMLTSLVIFWVTFKWFKFEDWWFFISERFPKIAGGEIAVKHASKSIYGTYRGIVHAGYFEQFGFTKEQFIDLTNILQIIFTLGMAVTLIAFTIYISKKVTKETATHYAIITYSVYMVMFLVFSKIVLLHYLIWTIPVYLFLLWKKPIYKHVIYNISIGLSLWLVFYGHGLNTILLHSIKPTTLGLMILLVLVAFAVGDPNLASKQTK